MISQLASRTSSVLFMSTPLIRPIRYIVSSRDQSFMGTIESRKIKLEKIYTKPLQHLKKYSEEYNKLIQSGDLWENHFKPFDLTKEESWSKVNNKNLKALDELYDKLFDRLSHNDSFNSAVSHQSVQVEGYTLSSDDSYAIYDNIKPNIESLNSIDIPTLVNRVIADIPHLKSSLDQVKMFSRNVLAQWEILHGDELSEERVKNIHRLLVDDEPQTMSIKGKPIINKAGEYRAGIIQAYEFYNTIYPYPAEVPSLMRRLFKLLYEETNNPTLHPIVFALKFYTIFLHIHPFHDGNGRLGRLILMFLLKRCRHVPPVYPDLQRMEYLFQIYSIQNGDPEPFLQSSVKTMYSNLESLDEI